MIGTKDNPIKLSDKNFDEYFSEVMKSTKEPKKLINNVDVREMFKLKEALCGKIK